MRASRLSWLIVASLLVSGQAHADWKRDYVRGERAIRDGNFVEAEALFRSAAREEPTPDDRKRFEGVVFRDYAPQFWAGFAAWRQGACDRALDYWQDGANSASALAKIKDFKSQQDRGIADCRQQLAQNSPKPAQPEVVAPVVTPPIAKPVVTAPPVAAQPVNKPAPPPTQSQPAVTVTPTPAANTPAAAATSAAPAQLTSAVEAWLAGRYGDVLAVQASSVADGRARAHVHMLRAAARFAQSELGTESSAQAAQDEVRAARRALANISPNATLFSPRFRSFWQTTR